MGTCCTVDRYVDSDLKKTLPIVARFIVHLDNQRLNSLLEQEYRPMQLRWPFPKPAHDIVDEAQLAAARAELAAAEADLECARTAYQRLLDQPDSELLRRQQTALDAALHRYHGARHLVRRLEQPNVDLVAWTGPARRRPSRRNPSSTSLAKG
jgi:hypothetical protein